MSGGDFERVEYIDGSVGINPWDQPDMKVRKELFDPKDRGLTEVTTDEVAEIIGVASLKWVRTLLRQMGLFKPDQPKNTQVWWYRPADLLPVGKPEKK